MKRYFGIGKESAERQVVEPRLLPVIPMGHERCDLCGAIKPLDALAYLESDEAGDPRYECRPPDGPSGPVIDWALAHGHQVTRGDGTAIAPGERHTF